MTAISDCFAALRSQGRCALIPFLTAGDPDLETTRQALLALDREGADLIELGVPYSDPLADGPVIQAAATRALQAGTRLDDVLALLKDVRSQIKAPVVLFTYCNPILNRGFETFLDQIAAAGANGLVVPDLPLEESQRLSEVAAERGIDLILLIAPTSSADRITAISEQARGFIYLVSVTGVTGMRQGMQSRVADLLQEIRQGTDKPIGVGFGISGAEQARQVRDWGADGVIVGSAFVNRLQEQGVEGVAALCRELRQAIDRQPALS
ncbi:tryptophan synthase subunit alpha [Synechococcus elongatus]|uniref:Tryptophan synthase alpha chain n=2 Tax=Synechococcus elongatus TaxID=32046 RepID=A0AAN1QQ74_SYNEL|nr:tryptophan synthase subunit alpha [Synechococcus elongatus]AZB73575.1 tryptophan synthase subunit alpha [Synechococcus elongatus PCC 11801]QFZ91233.1 tryptophan synthase subunit alpha [Synechococcus elongatus PCC 11802]